MHTFTNTHTCMLSNIQVDKMKSIFFIKTALGPVIEGLKEKLNRECTSDHLSANLSPRWKQLCKARPTSCFKLNKRCEKLIKIPLTLNSLQTFLTCPNTR
ncbi:hypothetical protein XENOCAPTIV_029825 [Xenoophorus captivus]|uniref:Uncharacterized protein n=1 Tax=Xenoophorus captivus TaxID=1517983 RepID=A0ABV0QYT8_9TELE